MLVPIPLLSPPCSIEKRTDVIKQPDYGYYCKADDTTQPASGQPPTWATNGTARELGALLPVLSCTYCIYDGGVHTGMVASKPSKGTRKRTGMVKKKKTKKWTKIEEREKTVEPKRAFRRW